MSSEVEQLQPFSAVVDDLRRLCLEHCSGILYIHTDQAHGATFTLSQGEIIDIAYRKDRGMQALELMQKINMALYMFKDDPALRTKPSGSIETQLPSSEVILNKLSIKPAPMLSEVRSDKPRSVPELRSVPEPRSVPELRSEKGVKKVLIVEDSGLSRKALVNLFAGKGHEVMEAVDGVEALEKLEPGGVDLVLLDLILPKMDGYEVLSTMKESENFKNIPVIVLTAREALLDDIKEIMSETDAYLTKPVNATELRGLVSKYLGGDE